MWAGTGNTWPRARALVSLQGSCEGTVFHWSQLSTFVGPWGMLGLCGGVNGINHSSPWKCRRPVSQSLARKAYIPTSLPKGSHQRLNADWESLCRKLFLSQLIYMLQSDGVNAQSLSLESNFSHLLPVSLAHTACVTLPSLLPLSCLHTCSLISLHTYPHTPSGSRSLPLLASPFTTRWLMPFGRLRFIVTHHFNVVY